MTDTENLRRLSIGKSEVVLNGSGMGIFVFLFVKFRQLETVNFELVRLCQTRFR